MPSKISQIELNGVLYDIKDSEALKILNEGEQNEIVILSSNDKEVIASGTTLADIFARIDVATIVDHVENGEWIVNIVNSDGSIDMSNYYSKSRVDELIAASRAGLVANDDPRLSDARTPTTHTHEVTDIIGLSSGLGTGVEIVNPETGRLLYSFDEIISMWENKKILLFNGRLLVKVFKNPTTSYKSLMVYYLGDSERYAQSVALRKAHIRGTNYTWDSEEMVEAEFSPRDIQDEAGNSLIVTNFMSSKSNMAIIPTEVAEITSGANTLAYTTSEILSMFESKTLLYSGRPVLRVSDNSPSGIKIYYVDVDSVSPYDPMLKCAMYDSNGDIQDDDDVGYWMTPSEKTKLTDITVPTSDINANTLARHTHSNKTVLDKFGESNGAPTYDGNTIGAVTDVQDSEGQSVVVNGIATIPEIPTVTVEDVRDSNNNSLVENGIAVIPEHNIDDYDIVALCASIDGVDAVTINGDYIGTDVNTAILF